MRDSQVNRLAGLLERAAAAARPQFDHERFRRLYLRDPEGYARRFGVKFQRRQRDERRDGN